MTSTRNDGNDGTRDTGNDITWNLNPKLRNDKTYISLKLWNRHKSRLWKRRHSKHALNLELGNDRKFGTLNFKLTNFEHDKNLKSNLETLEMAELESYFELGARKRSKLETLKFTKMIHP